MVGDRRENLHRFKTGQIRVSCADWMWLAPVLHSVFGMNGEIITHDGDVVDKAIKKLKTTGKLRVKADEEFWILCKSWRNSGFPYGYSPSKDGIKPLDKYRMFSHSELYNWISHLEILDQ